MYARSGPYSYCTLVGGTVSLCPLQLRFSDRVLRPRTHSVLLAGIPPKRLSVRNQHGALRSAYQVRRDVARAAYAHRWNCAAGPVVDGSDSAIATLARELPTLPAHPKFDRITEALYTYYQPHGDSSMGVLQQLVSLHSDAAGIDAATGSALQKIGSKAVLPAMAELLDSRDPQAQLRAAWFLGYFTLFAAAAGNIGHEIGPWGLGRDPTSHAPRRFRSDTARIFCVLELMVVRTSIRSRFCSSMMARCSRRRIPGWIGFRRSQLRPIASFGSGDRRGRV
jgi:hypothetical protein